MANLVLLCHQHHQGVHEGDWTVSPTPARDGEHIHPGHPDYWQFTSPAASWMVEIPSR
ncbi:MAG: hypothetical protein F2911_08770 [Actinobacteria bacterium]|nr:hypothetical protein [Actinomycetota bacterium]